MVRNTLILLIAFGLAACGSSGGARYGSGSRHPGLECAPFARELSGIALYGDAATWWDAAEGQYARGSRPVIGAVLVFRRSSRLAAGHLSVVTRQLAPRQVLVTHANWVPEELGEDQLVVDVSDANDWSAVRVWYPPVNQMGASVYATYGFVLPPREATREELARAVKPASVYAIDTRGRPPPRARYAGAAAQ